ncbi:MAG: carbon-nitrogen hydrolase family protein [Vulcanimicrobiaceae bacterium]
MTSATAADPASTAFRIAAAQYDIGFFADWQAYEAKIGAWFASAVADGARFLVFPEYFSMELASLFGPDVYGSLARQLDAMQDVRGAFVALFARLAKRHGVYVVAGSYPVREAETFRNRSYLFRPDGTYAHQDKLQMTRFENERWCISAGETVETFETAFGRIGIAVCYDGEFPLIARRQVEAGAALIVVPSCTDTLAGYHRVRIGARARALENQCYVVQASTVGTAPWSEAVDVNVGAAGIFTPVDFGYPDDGVLATGDLNRACWVAAEIDLATVERVRREGQVFNHRDWAAHLRFA